MFYRDAPLSQLDIGEQIRTLRSEVRARSAIRRAIRIASSSKPRKTRRFWKGRPRGPRWPCLPVHQRIFFHLGQRLPPRREGHRGAHVHFCEWRRIAQVRARASEANGLGLGKLDGFLARIGMPAPIRAHAWATPPEIMYDLTPSEIVTMTCETAFARARAVSCRSNADPLPRHEPLLLRGHPAINGCGRLDN